MYQTALIFGSNGTLGSSIFDSLQKQKYEIYTAGANKRDDSKDHIFCNYSSELDKNTLKRLPALDVIIWSHGLNCSDSIENFELINLNNLINSNVIFIASCISKLIELKKIKKGARLLIVSSIWQLESRKNKFSYSVSKSALQGLVKSASIDLGSRSILINALLPGVIDSPMTRTHLSDEQINDVINETALSRLATAEDISSAVCFLTSSQNKAITGQFIIVDGGFLGLKKNL